MYNFSNVDETSLLIYIYNCFILIFMAYASWQLSSIECIEI